MSSEGDIPIPEAVDVPRTAKGIYDDIEKAGNLPGPRTICIEDVADGSSNSHDTGYVIWRPSTRILNFTRYTGANIPSRHEWYKDLFAAEVLQSGFIILKREPFQDVRTIEEWLIVFHEGKYLSSKYESGQKRLLSDAPEPFHDEEILEVIDKIALLCAAPQQIADLFGTYDLFLEALIQELGGEPDPGIVTDNYEGSDMPVTIYGEYEANNLHYLVANLTVGEINKRKKKEQRKKAIDDRFKPNTKYL